MSNTTLAVSVATTAPTYGWKQDSLQKTRHLKIVGLLWLNDPKLLKCCALETRHMRPVQKQWIIFRKKAGSTKTLLYFNTEDSGVCIISQKWKELSLKIKAEVASSIIFTASHVRAVLQFNRPIYCIRRKVGKKQKLSQHQQTDWMSSSNRDDSITPWDLKRNLQIEL